MWHMCNYGGIEFFAYGSNHINPCLPFYCYMQSFGEVFFIVPLAERG